jgi:acyl-CoA reductase-like NAD-dependent aldehyde dehydrogenase
MTGEQIPPEHAATSGEYPLVAQELVEAALEHSKHIAKHADDVDAMAERLAAGGNGQPWRAQSLREFGRRLRHHAQEARGHAEKICQAESREAAIGKFTHSAHEHALATRVHIEAVEVFMAGLREQHGFENR